MIRRAAHVLFWLGAAAGVVGAWGLVAKHLVDVKAVQPSARPDAIVWGDRVFSNERDLARWLRSRGSSFATWAAEHPAALATVQGRGQGAFTPPPRQATVTPPPRQTTVTPPPRQTTVAVASNGQPGAKAARAGPRTPVLPESGGSSVWESIVEGLLLAAALVLVIAGSIPVEFLQFRGITPPSAAARVYLCGAGLATGTGVLAAIVLG